jgi:hypothetical protein
MRFGFIFFKVLYPRSHFSIVPLTKFSITISDFLTKSLKMICPTFFLKFREIDFFPLFKIENNGKIVLSYRINNLKLSPKGGGYSLKAISFKNSTLITSAPCSEKKVVAHAPLMN